MSSTNAENRSGAISHGRRAPKGMKVLAGCAIGIAASAVLVICGFIAYIRLTFSDFYDQATAEFETPGLRTGFVPQDIAYAEAGNAWLFSGYDGNDGPSPIWRINSDGSNSYISVIEPDGNVYRGHGGGLAVASEFSYLTCDNGYLVIKTEDLLKEGNKVEVQSLAKVDVGFDPAFINMQNDVLYTGVFYYEGPYDTPDEMHLTSPDGTQNHAVMYAYEADKSAEYGVSDQPFAVYSIPDKVQGVALTSSNQFVFSTSWAFQASTLPMYSSDNLEPYGTYDVNGSAVDLYFMDGRNFEGEVEAPPMMEGIIYHDGKIWMANESACNKYKFGKLYGGGTVFSLPM